MDLVKDTRQRRRRTRDRWRDDVFTHVSILLQRQKYHTLLFCLFGGGTPVGDEVLRSRGYII